jgi:hypothetical protein
MSIRKGFGVDDLNEEAEVSSSLKPGSSPTPRRASWAGLCRSEEGPGRTDRGRVFLRKNTMAPGEAIDHVVVHIEGWLHNANLNARVRPLAAKAYSPIVAPLR